MRLVEKLSVLGALAAISGAVGLALYPPTLGPAPLAVARAESPAVRPAPLPALPVVGGDVIAEDVSLDDSPAEGMVESPDDLAGLGYAWGEGAGTAWRDAIEALQADPDASARLAGALQNTPDGPVARGLIVALGELGGEVALDALRRAVEVHDATLLTRLMAMDALAKAARRSGNLSVSRSFHAFMGELATDEALDPRQRGMAARLARRPIH